MLTIQQLSEVSGVTKRTLRYYEQQGLLQAVRTENNYRVYPETAIVELQTIMFFKYFDFTLAEIKEILQLDRTAQLELLVQQQEKLVLKKRQLEMMLITLEKTITEQTGGQTMTSAERFEAFKDEKIKENEAKYGTEIREKYGEETVAQSNQRYQGLTKAQFERMDELQHQIGVKLAEYLKQPTTSLGQDIFRLHQEFLQITWPNYTLAAHRNLGEMYVADPRFTKFYNDLVGDARATATLNKIIQDFAQE